jgi:hypothetical protein
MCKADVGVLLLCSSASTSKHAVPIRERDSLAQLHPREGPAGFHTSLGLLLSPLASMRHLPSSFDFSLLSLCSWYEVDPIQGGTVGNAGI